MVVGRASAIAAVVCAMATVAHADEPTAPSDHPVVGEWLFDTEAMVFLWIPAIGTYYVDGHVAPRSSPLAFSVNEGGAERRRAYEIPGTALTVGGVAVAGAMLLGDDPARFHHAKGLAESLSTTGLVTATTKAIFGRHRPDYDPMLDGNEGRRSFPSGHATRAFSVLTYAALYLRYHGFDQWREPGTTPWWEVAAYSGLGALAVGFGAERVVRNRHNLSDVAAGSLIGAGGSIAFFYWQERQYRKTKRARREALPIDLLGSPASHARAPGQPDGLPPIHVPGLSFDGTF